MRFYFGFRSPYAWLASRQLADRLPAAALADLELVPFFNPGQALIAQLAQAGGEFLYRTMSRERHFYILHDVRRLASRLGYPIRWPVDRPDTDWERPHLAFLSAARQGCAWPCLAAVFRARWEQGRDICSREVLADIAAEIGLPADTLAGASEDPALRAAALDVLLQTYRDSVFGVPYFIVGREPYWGFDRLALALEQWGYPEIARQLPFWPGDPGPDKAGAAP